MNDDRDSLDSCTGNPNGFCGDVTLIVKKEADERGLHLKLGGKFAGQPGTLCWTLTGTALIGPLEFHVWTTEALCRLSQANVWLCIGDAGLPIHLDAHRIAVMRVEGTESLERVLSYVLREAFAARERKKLVEELSAHPRAPIAVESIPDGGDAAAGSEPLSAARRAAAS